MSLVKQEFVLVPLDHVGPSAKPHALIKRLLDATPEVVFYTPSTPSVSFPDANSHAPVEERNAWNVTFTYPVRMGEPNGPQGLAAIYVDIKGFIEEVNLKNANLENALSAMGVISGQLNQYFADVHIGQWQLTEALIVGVSISEEGQTSEGGSPTHVAISVDFSAVLR